MYPKFSEKFELTVVPVTTDRPIVPGFQELVDVWHSKRGSLFLPARESFDMPSLRPWLGNINFSIMTDHGPFFKLFGSKNAEEFNKDLTRRYLVENLYQDRRQETLENYQYLSRYRGIGLFYGMSIIYETGHKDVSVLVLPLSVDGQDVTGFLHYLRFGRLERKCL